jgi:hypothetical protein
MTSYYPNIRILCSGAVGYFVVVFTHWKMCNKINFRSEKNNDFFKNVGMLWLSESPQDKIVRIVRPLSMAFTQWIYVLKEARHAYRLTDKFIKTADWKTLQQA